jgi:putative transposase
VSAAAARSEHRVSLRSGQYASDDFLAAIDALQMVASMGRKGNCWDNAVAESFFATLKAEEIKEPYVSKQDAHRGIASYIHGFYNPVSYCPTSLCH